MIVCRDMLGMACIISLCLEFAYAIKFSKNCWQHYDATFSYVKNRLH